MLLELQSASNFLVHLIRLSNRANISDSLLQKFKTSLVEVLKRRYRDHWFVEKPFKGSGYRCIRINGKMDPVIAQAGDACGLPSTLIHSTFPSELTMWIDPLEVSYRIGENGSICVLYEYKEGVTTKAWEPNLNNKNSSSSSSSNSNNAKNLAPSSGSTPNTPTKKVTIINENEKLDNTCKDTLRKMDYLLDPRKSVSIEQLAQYVSS